MSAVVKDNLDLVKFIKASNDLKDMGYEVGMSEFDVRVSVNGETLPIFITDSSQIEGFAAGVRYERERNKKDEE